MDAPSHPQLNKVTLRGNAVGHGMPRSPSVATRLWSWQLDEDLQIMPIWSSRSQTSCQQLICQDMPLLQS